MVISNVAYSRLFNEIEIIGTLFPRQRRSLAITFDEFFLIPFPFRPVAHQPPLHSHSVLVCSEPSVPGWISCESEPYTLN
ncbi:hypothetical protein LB506_002311 [Fusarium annulatum]|nr:hypothetical protein LB506_002311 [Fusarium annulatum]